MRIRLIAAAGLGTLALTACTPADDAPPAAAAPEAAVATAADTAPAGPAEGDAAPSAPDPAAPRRGGVVSPPDRTPPTLPIEPDMRSPATSPPPQ